MRRALRIAVVAAGAATAAACHAPAVVNTGEPPPKAPPGGPTAPSTPALNRASLVNSFDFFVDSAGSSGYFFTTPSGRWDCAIIPRRKAGCQRAAAPQSAIGIGGAPDAVSGADGQSQPPNAIEVGRDGDGRFVRLEEDDFVLSPGPAEQLPFDRTLVAAGFRCNVQEDTGVSCLNEWTGRGFTFSAQQWSPDYVGVPVGAAT